MGQALTSQGGFECCLDQARGTCALSLRSEDGGGNEIQYMPIGLMGRWTQGPRISAVEAESVMQQLGRWDS